MHAKVKANKTSVSILSDSRLFRETTRAWLARRKEIHWVATAGSIRQLQQRLGGRATDVLLAHAPIDGALGTELLYEVRTLLPATRLIVLESRRSEQDLVRWIEAGAADYLQQNSTSGDLLQSIRAAASGCPSCAVCQHTRVFGAATPTTWKASRSDGPSRAQTLGDNELDTALRIPAGLLRQSLARQRKRSRRAVDRGRDFSLIPIQ
jgi:DNA-binding NarL/FixJ family response regulator